MAFQNIASNEVLRGQEYFRLNQEIESSGDIFEIDVSAKALAIGPDSDFSNLKLTYYDPNAVDEVSQSTLKSINVSVGNPFVGRIDALNATPIPGSNIAGAPQTPARLLVSLNDRIEPTYNPYARAFGEPIIRVSPRIDFFAFLTDPPGLLRERPDKSFFFPVVPNPGTSIFPPFNDLGSTWILVPYYGRRFARVTLTNTAGLGGTDPGLFLNLAGIRLNVGEGGTENNNAAEVKLGEAAIPNDGSVNLTTFAREDGTFDLLQIEYNRDENITLDIPTGELMVRVDVSDREG